MTADPSEQSLVIQAHTLDACRLEAARKLGIRPDQVVLNILESGPPRRGEPPRVLAEASRRGRAGGISRPRVPRDTTSPDSAASNGTDKAAESDARAGAGAGVDHESSKDTTPGAGPLRTGSPGAASRGASSGEIHGEASGLGPTSRFGNRLHEVLARIETAERNLHFHHDQHPREALQRFLRADGPVPESRRRGVLDIAKLLDLPLRPEAPTSQTRVDGEMRLAVEKDGMTAYLTVLPPRGGGRAIVLADVLGELIRHRVISGIYGQALRKAVDEGAHQAVHRLRVADGRPTEDGEDGCVEFLVELPHQERIVREDGTIDHHGHYRPTLVETGQTLARLHPPGPGRDGITVTGERLEAKAGRAVKARIGKNVALDRESGAIHALVNGVLDYTDGVIAVEPVFLVRGDVDMSVGHIDFPGDVHVAGSVRAGFSVVASGSIEIEGGVEACTLVARDGDITIGQGVVGHHQCSLTAGGSIRAKYIENATLFARGEIEAPGGVLHSDLIAGTEVICMGGRGCIAGGSVRAGERVQAKRIGTPAEPPTLIGVGVGIESLDQLRHLDQRLARLQAADQAMTEMLKTLAARRRGGRDTGRATESSTESKTTAAPSDAEAAVTAVADAAVTGGATESAESQAAAPASNTSHRHAEMLNRALGQGASVEMARALRMADDLAPPAPEPDPSDAPGDEPSRRHGATPKADSEARPPRGTDAQHRTKPARTAEGARHGEESDGARPDGARHDDGRPDDDAAADKPSAQEKTADGAAAHPNDTVAVLQRGELALRTRQARVAEAIAEARAERERVLREAERTQRGEIQVSTRIHGRVTLEIGASVRTLHRSLGPSRFAIDPRTHRIVADGERTAHDHRSAS